MAKAKKLPSGNWRTQVCYKGTKKSFTADSKKESEFMALEWSNGKKKERINKTIGECVEEYIKLKENVLSPTTIHSYKRMFHDDMSDLKNINVDELTQLQVQKFVNELALKKSAKSVKNAHGLLSAVLNVFLPDIRLRTTLPTVPKKIKQLPPVEQVVAAICGTDIELPCLMALWLGMRMSEIRGVKKSDISGGILVIHQTIVTVGKENITKESTKTYDSTRLIAVPEYILNLVEKLPPDQERLVNISGNALYNRFVRLLKRSNVTHMSFHDLRHLNASTMLALGVPDKYAMERGGWSTTNVMKSVYQHTLTEERKKADEKIDSFFSKMMTNSHEKSHD